MKIEVDRPEPKITLEFTEDEAAMLAAIIGKLTATSGDNATRRMKEFYCALFSELTEEAVDFSGTAYNTYSKRCYLPHDTKYIGPPNRE